MMSSTIPFRNAIRLSNFALQNRRRQAVGCRLFHHRPNNHLLSRTIQSCIRRRSRRHQNPASSTGYSNGRVIFFSSGNQECIQDDLVFDPFQLPSSAAILRQEDFELSAEELDLKRALEQFQRVGKISGRSKDNQTGSEENDQLQQTALEELQQAYMNLMYWEEALKIEQWKCQLYFEPNTDEYADSIHAQGKLHLRQEDFTNSKQLYLEALEYFQATQNSIQQGHVLISLAGWYFFRNQLDEALQSLHQAESLLDSNPSLLVKCLDNQGLIYRLWGEFYTALDKYQQALQVVVDKSTQWALQMHRADMLLALEETSDALQVYQDLLQEISGSNTQQQKPTDRGIQGVLLHNIASIHVEQGEYEMAMEEFRQALKMKQEAGGEHNPEVAKTLNSLGALHAGIFGEKLQALECFQKALLIARIHSEGDPQTDPDVLSALQNIATMEQQLYGEKSSKK